MPCTRAIPRKIALLCLLLAATGSAQASGSLSLPEALSAAFAQNPELAAAGREIGIAEGERRQAGLIPNPQLSWEVEDTRRETRTTTVTLSQPLELGGKRGARIAVAGAGQTIAQLDLERQRNGLRADVVQAFHAALRAQTALELAQQSQSLTERGLRVVQGRVTAGQSSPVEATRAQVQLAQAQAQVRRAASQRSVAYQALARLTGSPVARFDRLLATDLSPGAAPAVEALLARVEQTAEWRLAAAQVERGEASLGSEKAQRIPDLTVSLGSQYSREDRERVNVVGLSMPLPLFDRNQGNVLVAARRADQARDLRNAVELRLRSETRSALSQWATAMQEVQAYDRTILPSAQQAVDTATRGFEMGKFAFLDVLDAQRTLIEARGLYLQALASATDARAQVERLYGDLEGGL
ncbi:MULTISPECIES: TolC family protein [unclassified Pseudomonas]|uniref:TolC family protein n=1 Tax=unclassified Pseudomonas TaxID=196821 RepID=UPI000A0E1A69|nr:MULTISPECIES: TolC family protein [unclassified Pseudomonas]SMF31073.1 outer membrane protein, cobalt-zinc-cadmium efflux system [Pseudomonas sp. LAIL14HWK12:I11]SMR78136.1 outer membrane protein, cobalt-zinc-cadmium efflux system [Pseudomonas sp. LAIL14HWK12:I10]SOD04434.1 outer membrane protein, cobalt-zinc-cadmium efflux system [Pseudomonas sp. LAIL14HWK12:I8]